MVLRTFNFWRFVGQYRDFHYYLRVHFYSFISGTFLKLRRDKLVFLGPLQGGNEIKVPKTKLDVRLTFSDFFALR